jgi:hypothetical protein
MLQPSAHKGARFSHKGKRMLETGHACICHKAAWWLRSSATMSACCVQAAGGRPAAGCDILVQGSKREIIIKQFVSIDSK